MMEGTRLSEGLVYDEGPEPAGSIRRVAVWNVALSDAQINSLAVGKSPYLVQTENLLRYSLIGNRRKQ